MYPQHALDCTQAGSARPPSNPSSSSFTDTSSSRGKAPRKARGASIADTRRARRGGPFQTDAPRKEKTEQGAHSPNADRSFFFSHALSSRILLHVRSSELTRSLTRRRTPLQAPDPLWPVSHHRTPRISYSPINGALMHLLVLSPFSLPPGNITLRRIALILPTRRHGQAVAPSGCRAAPVSGECAHVHQRMPSVTNFSRLARTGNLARA